MLLLQQFQLTEAEASDTGASFYHVPHPPEGFDKGTWHFLETPVSTPGGSSNHGETSDLRRRKLRLLVQDLTALQRKLEGHVDAAGGFEPGVTLKDASGEVGAVVVGSDLTLLAAPSAASGSVPEPLHPPGYVSGSVPEPMHPPGYADGSKKRPAEPSKDEQPHLKTAKDETKEELSLGHCSPRRMRPKQGSRSLDRRSLSQGRVAFSWAGGVYDFEAYEDTGVEERVIEDDGKQEIFAEEAFQAKKQAALDTLHKQAKDREATSVKAKESDMTFTDLVQVVRSFGDRSSSSAAAAAETKTAEDEQVVEESSSSSTSSSSGDEAAVGLDLLSGAAPQKAMQTMLRSPKPSPNPRQRTQPKRPKLPQLHPRLARLLARLQPLQAKARAAAPLLVKVWALALVCCHWMAEPAGLRGPWKRPLSKPRKASAKSTMMISLEHESAERFQSRGDPKDGCFELCC